MYSEFWNCIKNIVVQKYKNMQVFLQLKIVQFQYLPGQKRPVPHHREQSAPSLQSLQHGPLSRYLSNIHQLTIISY